MTAKLLQRTVLGLLACAAATNASAVATITIINTDGAGEGFNDPAVPAADAGCQSGETLGQCRLRVFNVAAAQWGQLLDSDVTITVNAAMNPLTCAGSSATLGSAGPLSAFADFPNAPKPATAYQAALANSLAGEDLAPTTSDIRAQFNVSMDNGTCLNGTAGWWYDTNPNTPRPANRTPLLPVVFHEIGHGLGFTSLYDNADGTQLTDDTPIWGYYLYDEETHKYWKDMTDAERNVSKINDPHLVWAGTRTNKQSPKFLGPPAKLIVNSPAGIAGNYDAQTAEFGANVATHPATGDVVYVDDGVVGAVDADHPTAGTVNDGCETPFANAAAVAGKIALVDRGYCNFTLKAKNAQLAGAIGVIVANNAASGLPGMGGSDASITIPSLGVAQATGTSIKANLASPGVNATLGTEIGAPLAGTQSGCIRLNAPDPVVLGSSVSHFTADAFPNLLMEPALNTTIFDKVDLTLPLFQDIGWHTGVENILFLDGFDPNPCPFVQP
ncbi:PA domain-containing protein [Dokdonella sp.]|uniref:PA domain-containing protein n=1 Tax=Dokdonella sp. TaxID=2291710 RepID=UPI0025C18ED9|nr:PA domain-containing protein [Dokdonella sp.]